MKNAKVRRHARWYGLALLFMSVALYAQQDVSITLDGWSGGPCDKIPWDEKLSRGGCDTITPFTWTRDYARFPLTTGAQTTSVSFLDPGDPDWKISRVQIHLYLAPDWAVTRDQAGCAPYQAPVVNMILTAKINDQLVQTLNPAGYVAQDACVTYPNCGGPPQSFFCSGFLPAWFDATTPGDFPGFIHGGINTFSLTFENSQYQSDVPTLSIEKADLILTDTCGVCGCRQ